MVDPPLVPELGRWRVEVPGWFPAGVQLVATAEGMVCEVRDVMSARMVGARAVPWPELDGLRHEEGPSGG